MISAKGLSHETTILVDTVGAEINDIKKRNLHPNPEIDTNTIINIVGITKRKIKTIGLNIINF